jgi:hypothetical protein
MNYCPAKRGQRQTHQRIALQVHLYSFFQTQKGSPLRDLDRNTSFLVATPLVPSKKLKRREAEIEDDIKAKLLEIYKEKGTDLYYRLAPLQAPQGTAQNDSSAPGVTLDATREYLEQPPTVNKIDDIAGRIPLVSAAC